MKRCPRCRKDLPLSHFRDLRDRSGRTRKQSYCKPCEKDWANDRRAGKPRQWTGCHA